MAQQSNATAFNRYPAIFRAARDYMQHRGAPADGGGLRILSFGCSDASEVHSLRAYFPDAAIFGCDINLAAATSAHANSAGLLFKSTAQAIEQHGPYDLIFAMSVLCWQPVPLTSFDIERHFPFSEFSGICDMLAATLAPGGLLALYNTSYSFYDVPVSIGFRPLRSPTIPSNGEVGKWDHAGALLTEREEIDVAYFVHALRNRCVVSDELFRDCLFIHEPGGALTLASRPMPDDPLQLVAQRRIGPALEARGDVVGYNLHETLVASPRGDHWLGRQWHRISPEGTTAFGQYWQRAAKDQLALPPVSAQMGLSFPVSIQPNSQFWSLLSGHADGR